MAGSRSSPPLEVTGGSAGLSAQYAELRSLATAYDTAAGQMRHQAGRGAQVLADGDLLASAVLAPATFAAAEAAVLAATTGPRGIGTASIGWEADAAVLRAVVADLEAVDAAIGSVFEEVDVGPLRVPVPLGTVAGALGVDGAAGLTARLYPTEGAPAVTPRPDLTLSVGRGSRPPGSLSGMLVRLQEVNTWDDGSIAVQSWRVGGTTRHVVYLPGTDDLTTLPWAVDRDTRDLPTNLRLLDGEDTTYTRGILGAMDRAGVRPGDPVVLVGHSQGGMAAVQLATHATRLRIVQVVTAGSPIALAPAMPAGTRLLSLEQRGDLVPLLDGADNPDRRRQVTVVFDDHPGGVVDAHSLRHYVAGAAGVDGSADPSLTEQLRRLRWLGFLGPGTHARTQAFQITR